MGGIGLGRAASGANATICRAAPVDRADFHRNRFSSSGAFPGLTGSQELTSHAARASIAYKF